MLPSTERALPDGPAVGPSKPEKPSPENCTFWTPELGPAVLLASVHTLSALSLQSRRTLCFWLSISATVSGPGGFIEPCSVSGTGLCCCGGEGFAAPGPGMLVELGLCAGCGGPSASFRLLSASETALPPAAARTLVRAEPALVSGQVRSGRSPCCRLLQSLLTSAGLEGWQGLLSLP